MKEVIERDANRSKRSSPPVLTAEARENQLINLAVDLAEKKLRDGTASSQIITTLLQLATTKAQLDMEKIRSDLRVSEAKIKHIESQETSQDLYKKAIDAFRSYSGQKNEDFYEEDIF